MQSNGQVVAMVGSLVHAFPVLTPLLQEHLDDQFGEVLCTVFLSDLLRWLLLNMEAQPDLVRGVLDWIETEHSRGDAGINDCIDTGFVEMLPFSNEPGVEIWTMLGPELRAEARRQGHWPDLV